MVSVVKSCARQIQKSSERCTFKGGKTVKKKEVRDSMKGNPRKKRKKVRENSNKILFSIVNRLNMTEGHMKGLSGHRRRPSKRTKTVPLCHFNRVERPKTKDAAVKYPMKRYNRILRKYDF